MLGLGLLVGAILGIGLLSVVVLGLGLIRMVLHLIILIGIIWIVCKIFIGDRGGNHVVIKHTDNSLEILRARYARGEIDAYEFNRRKQDLLR